MLTQEVFDAVMQERRREATELQRQQKAEVLRRRGATPRSGPSSIGHRLGRLSFSSFVTRVFRSASVS